MEADQQKIWTIGHSTHTIDLFISVLSSFQIEIVADIRSLPGSRKYPQYNKENLEIVLPLQGIQYVHLPALGGRRKGNPHSKNTGWEHPAFRSYADYMETADFVAGIHQLEEIALQKRVAYMCAEVLWWRCHRSLVSDYLKWQGWQVWHIMAKDKATLHTYTRPARIIDNKLNYEKAEPPHETSH